MEHVNILWMRSFISGRLVAGGQYQRTSLLISPPPPSHSPAALPPTMGLHDDTREWGLRFLMVI